MFSFADVMRMLGTPKRSRWTKRYAHHETPKSCHRQRKARRRAALRIQKRSRRINFAQARKR
jgi:hypothetical protein